MRAARSSRRGAPRGARRIRSTGRRSALPAAETRGPSARALRPRASAWHPRPVKDDRLPPPRRHSMDDRSRFDEFARLATEQRNPRTLDLDTLDVPAILERISAEDHTVPAAVARELPYVARAVELVVASFRAGGRLI